jgi:hypothetical protein
MKDITEREDLILAEYPVRIEILPETNNRKRETILDVIEELSKRKSQINKCAIKLHNLRILSEYFDTLSEFFRAENLHTIDGMDAYKGVYESRHRTRLVMEKYGLRFDYNEYSIWWESKDPWNRLLHECPTATRPKDLWHDKEEAKPNKPRKQQLKN